MSLERSCFGWVVGRMSLPQLCYMSHIVDEVEVQYKNLVDTCSVNQ